MRFTPDEFRTVQEERAADVLIIPSVESERGIAEMPEIMAMPSLRIFGLALSDASKMLGHDMDYEHPDVWDFVDRSVQLGRDHGVHITANTGYAFRSWDAISGRVQRMREHGIGMVMLQTSEFLYQIAVSDLVGRLRHEARA
jgi:2-keto-3-deoxy-L-rhamnonate aldolase RhmA